MRNFFYGWYFKCQSERQTLAMIPAVHKSGQKGLCSIQIITEDHVWNIEYPAAAFRQIGNDIWIGKNRFGERGVLLALHTPELNISGKIKFGPLLPLKYDIMGPFSMLPFLECRHSVLSMQHTVSGKMFVNGCPVAGFHFRGIIGVVIWKGREYRMATYLRARVVQAQNGEIRIVQGSLELEAKLLDEIRSPLRAPSNGDMSRTIHESAACRAYYRFRKGDSVFFSVETDRASFEYELL